QAEDGIRDFHVTGVQTCALPIWLRRCPSSRPNPRSCEMSKSMWQGVIPAITTPFTEDGQVDHAFLAKHAQWQMEAGCIGMVPLRSEERRVGKEGSSLCVCCL